MSRCVLLVSGLLAGLLTPVAFGAAPPCPRRCTVIHAVADLVVPPDTRPITLTIGPETKPSRPRKKRPTTEEQLIRQITTTIAPGTWDGLQGSMIYHPKNLSLVVSHSPSVLEQVSTLLADLRRKAEVNVCLEVRLMSVSEETFERIGIDFESKKGADLATDKLRSVLEAAQGDRRTTILQAPKVTCFDKQRVTIQLPFEDTNVTLIMTPAVTADRRSVRMNVKLQRQGAEDEKVKTVVADGCSIALPNWTVTRETRPVSGRPILSRIPYINRLFKNVAGKRESEKVFLMVTPRILVQDDAE